MNKKKETINKNQWFAMKATPDEWASYAMEIKGSINVLWNSGEIIISYSEFNGLSKKPAISRTWLLLAGFALENLIKGLVIAENPQFISKGRLNNKIKTHNLTKLSNMIESIEIEDHEKDLLRILETCIPSWGRYPIPLNVDDIIDEIPVTLEIKTMYDKLFDKLDLHLYLMIRHGWAGPHNCGSDAVIRSDYEDLPEGFENMSFEEIFNWRNDNINSNN